MYDGRQVRDRPDILVRIYVQDGKTGEGTDLMQDTSMGDRGQEES